MFDHRLYRCRRAALKQQLNQELDRKSNILAVADLYEPGMDVEDAYSEQITPRVVNLESGEYSDEFDPQSYDSFQAAKDPAQSRTLSGEKDIAGLSRLEKYSTVYLVGDPDDPQQLILPVRGQGLWGLMRGYLSVQGDGNTINGITFYSHSETPGLGGEVDNPRWKAQWEGKEIFAEDDSVQPDIQLVKGGARGETEVDALSGATLTSKGSPTSCSSGSARRGSANTWRGSARTSRAPKPRRWPPRPTIPKELDSCLPRLPRAS